MKHDENPFTRAIRKGEKQIGLWMTSASSSSSEVISSAGYDWVVIDMEHSPNDMMSVRNHLQIFASSPTTALARPDWNDTVEIKRLLDLGVDGLVIPMVQTVEEAKQAVAATRYPPRGVRGVSGVTRANKYGRVTDYFDRVEQETTVILQLETRAAIEQATEIAAVDGVSGIFFGPADISADMGMLGQAMAPEVWDLIWSAAHKLIAMDVPVGTLVLDAKFAAKLLNDGFTFVACGVDTAMLARAADNLLADVKKDT